MDTNKFLADFASAFDEISVEDLSLSTNFRDLDEWSSLCGLAIMSMIKDNYGITITPQEMRNSETIEDIYNLIRK